MTLPVIWVPGHLCGAWLYAAQLVDFGGVDHGLIADTYSDDNLGAMADRLLADAPERFIVAGLSMGGMVAMEVIITGRTRKPAPCNTAARNCSTSPGQFCQSALARIWR